MIQQSVSYGKIIMVTQPVTDKE